MAEPNPYEMNPWIWKRRALERVEDLEIMIQAIQRIKEEGEMKDLETWNILEGQFKRLKEQAEFQSAEFSRIIEEEAQ